MIRRFKNILEDSKWGKKIHQSGVQGEKIQSGFRRFKVGLEDSKWGSNIQIGVGRFKVELEDSKWDWKGG